MAGNLSTQWHNRPRASKLFGTQPSGLYKYARKIYSNISADSYHSRIGTLAFAQFHWVSRKNLSRLPETCHPFYCLSPLHKKGSRFSSGRSRSHYKQYTQVHCSLKPFQRSILQVRNALTSSVKRMCCAKNIQSSIWKAHPQREANQQSLFGKDTLLSKDEKQCISMNPKLMWMRNITVAKTKATVFGTKRKGTPQILPPKSKKASHIYNLQTTGLHSLTVLVSVTFSQPPCLGFPFLLPIKLLLQGECPTQLLDPSADSCWELPQDPVWLAACGQVFLKIWLHKYSHTSILIKRFSPLHSKFQFTSKRSEKAMAPHSSTLAWKIPWMEEPGRLQSMGSHRVGHDWSDLAAAVKDPPS